eukprot:8606979-Prorocentrum_lima.AAC.1
MAHRQLLRWKLLRRQSLKRRRSCLPLRSRTRQPKPRPCWRCSCPARTACRCHCCCGGLHRRHKGR